MDRSVKEQFQESQKLIRDITKEISEVVGGAEALE
jgi:F0F1-type ATP synthase gamma subunit